MYKGSVFVSDVIEKVLLLNPTSEEYINLGVVCDRNVFHKCISRDRKYINYSCAIALRNLIFREIENNNLKKEQLLKYFKEYLSSDVKKYIDDNCNINKIINLAISEFLNPNDIKIGEFKEGKVIHPSIKSISDLYIRTIKYLRSDIKTSIILLEKTIENIISAIIEHEDISCIKPSSCNEKILNTLEFKKIIPSDVIRQIKQLNNTFTDEDIKKVTSVNEKYINMLFLNVKHILEWFFYFYLENEQYFEEIYSKAHKFFYMENHNEVNVYDLDQLIEKGWTIEKLSETMLTQLSSKYPCKQVISKFYTFFRPLLLTLHAFYGNILL
jgi:hypothetical protein